MSSSSYTCPCSRLQELRLLDGKLHPAVLHAPAATLTKLVLESRIQLLPAAGSPGSEDVFSNPVDSCSTGCSLSPLAQQFHNALIQLSNLQHLELEYEWYPVQDTSRFGSALPHLTALTHLKLWWWCWDPTAWRQNLSTLTALRVLHLHNGGQDRQHMFPAGRQALVQLQGPYALYATGPLCMLQGPYALYDPRDEDRCAADGVYTLTAKDVEVMVRCCPNLQALQAHAVLHVSPEIASLRQLTRLEALWGANHSSTCPHGCCRGLSSTWSRVDKAAAARALAGLSSLQYLSLLGAQEFGVELCTALLQLARLTRLDLDTRQAAALSDAEAGLLARLTGLIELRMHRCGVSDVQLLQLAALPQLLTVHFSDHRLSPLFHAVAEMSTGSEVSCRQSLQNYCRYHVGSIRMPCTACLASSLRLLQGSPTHHSGCRTGWHHGLLTRAIHTPLSGATCIQQSHGADTVGNSAGWSWPLAGASSSNATCSLANNPILTTHTSFQPIPCNS